MIQVKKIGTRISLVNTGKPFFYCGVMDANNEWYEAGVMAAKYGNSVDRWAAVTLERERKWGINGIGDYAHSRLYTHPAHLPFIFILTPSRTSGPADLIAGLSKEVKARLPYQAPMLDIWDGRFRTAAINEVSKWRQTLGEFSHNPSVIGVTLDDFDYYWALRCQGEGYPHMGYIVACAAPTTFSKQAWVNWLNAKYKNIAALNSSWESSYSSFAQVLTEDGSSRWFGTDPFGLKNASVRFAADASHGLYNYTLEALQAMIAPLRAYDSTHLVFSPNCLGGNYLTLWDEVLQAIKDAGVSALHVKFSPADQNFATLEQAYDQTKLPIVCWWGATANRDSYFDKFASQCKSDYATQKLRGAQYARDLVALLHWKASDGTSPIVGVEQWAFSDGNAAEHSNYGQVTDKDEAYDGHEAPYGDYLTQATAANVAAQHSFASAVKPPVIQ